MSWKPIPLPPNRSSVNGNSLNISNVQFADEGYYVCEAENFLGLCKLYNDIYVESKIEITDR